MNTTQIGLTHQEERRANFVSFCEILFSKGEVVHIPYESSPGRACREQGRECQSLQEPPPRRGLESAATPTTKSGLIWRLPIRVANIRQPENESNDPKFLALVSHSCQFSDMTLIRAANEATKAKFHTAVSIFCKQNCQIMIPRHRWLPDCLSVPV